MSNKDIKRICGIPFPKDFDDLRCHLQLFLYAPEFQRRDEIWVSGERCYYTGTGRFEHAKVIAKILFPKKFEWHEWSDMIVRKACESNWMAVSGCGTSSKSTSIGVYALIWWMAMPTESAVIIASKTVESAQKRIWREVAKFYSLFTSLVGGYKDASIGSAPRPSICPISGIDRKKDLSHGLFVTALHGKELEKEIGYIKGFHPKRILVVADELDVLEDGGHALIDTFTDNLKTGAYEAQIIVLGNDPSLLNALGDVMQPAPGKPITLANVEWKSAKDWDCLRLDAWDSPNIKHNNRFSGLVRQSDIDDLIKRKGENSPSVYIQLHGIHPPEGADNTVLSEGTLLRYHCFETVIWQRDTITSASLDPAFGGDACIFRTFKRGNDKDGKLKISCEKTLTLTIDANESPDYQIAGKVKALCIGERIAPDEFILDSTGVGRGVSAILQREFSPRIQECVFGGAASDRIISAEHPVPANKEYDRKVTELWFQIREYVEADMIRNLDSVTATQLCSRNYEDKGTGGGRKLCIAKKEDMLHSPDEADALACAVELFVRKGIIPNIETPVTVQANKTFEKAVEEYDFDSSEEAYSNPLLDYADLQP